MKNGINILSAVYKNVPKRYVHKAVFRLLNSNRQNSSLSKLGVLKTTLDLLEHPSAINIVLSCVHSSFVNRTWLPNGEITTFIFASIALKDYIERSIKC